MSSALCLCGKTLTAEEIQYYGHRCESCERELSNYDSHRPTFQLEPEALPLPCPFCGGRVDPEGWLRVVDGVRGPECERCGATAQSMEIWNRRVS